MYIRLHPRTHTHTPIHTHPYIYLYIYIIHSIGCKAIYIALYTSLSDHFFEVASTHLDDDDEGEMFSVGSGPVLDLVQALHKGVARRLIVHLLQWGVEMTTMARPKKKMMFRFLCVF